MRSIEVKGRSDESAERPLMLNVGCYMPNVRHDCCEVLIYPPHTGCYSVLSCAKPLCKQLGNCFFRCSSLSVTPV